MRKPTFYLQVQSNLSLDQLLHAARLQAEPLTLHTALESQGPSLQSRLLPANVQRSRSSIATLPCRANSKGGIETFKIYQSFLQHKLDLPDFIHIYSINHVLNAAASNVETRSSLEVLRSEGPEGELQFPRQATKLQGCAEAPPSLQQIKQILHMHYRYLSFDSIICLAGAPWHAVSFQQKCGKTSRPSTLRFALTNAASDYPFDSPMKTIFVKVAPLSSLAIILLASTTCPNSIRSEDYQA